MKPIYLFLFLLAACASREPPDYTVLENVNFREEMHRFVINIKEYAEKSSPGFLVIPQNGHDLLPDNHRSTLRDAYLKAIDGAGQEELFFGLEGMDKPTPEEAYNWLLMLLAPAREAGKTVMVIDYCRKAENVALSYRKNREEGFISYAAPTRNLTTIPGPAPFQVNNRWVTSLADARNFLYLINPEKFLSRKAFISALTRCQYDILVIDLFFQNAPLTEKEVQLLKKKPQGGSRLVICYMSIGEAEEYRFYWKKVWNHQPPSWLDRENPRWPGNYKVRYWDKEWQKLILYNEDSYLNRILGAGFDGVYLDIIDGFAYFEEAILTPAASLSGNPH